MADRGVLHLPADHPLEVKRFNKDDLDEKFAYVVDKRIPPTPGTVQCLHGTLLRCIRIVGVTIRFIWNAVLRQQIGKLVKNGLGIFF
jgi:hypothetical protein